MARNLFLAGDDYLVTGIPGGQPVAGVPVRIYTQKTGGTQITDLVYVLPNGSLGGAVPGGVLYSDGDGLIPSFAGPDGGQRTVWGDHGYYGTRWALDAESTSGGGGGGNQFTSVLGKSSGTVTGADIVADTTVSGTYGPAVGSNNWLKLHAANLDSLLSGAVTRDSNGAATGGNVIWPDGTAGVYTATTVSTAFPGAVDAYTVTYASTPTAKTVTQPAVTRNGSGAVTNVPARTVA